MIVIRDNQIKNYLVGLPTMDLLNLLNKRNPEFIKEADALDVIEL